MIIRLRQHQSQSRPILWCWLSPALRSGLLVSGTWKLSTPAPPKPFRAYPDLVALLAIRGMQVNDPSRAERKLAQLGYYRLSGYWYPARLWPDDSCWIGRQLIETKIVYSFGVDLP